MKGINTTSLTQCFSTHGLPVIIVTDNGLSFTSKEFKLFNKKIGIKHIFTGSYHPLSNGTSERSVKTFKNAMKKIIKGKQCINLNTTLQFIILLTYTSDYNWEFSS